MNRHHELRPIASLDLKSFRRPEIQGNPSLIWRTLWYLVNATVFQSAILALIPSRFKTHLLRIFGAKVGAGLVCKPRVSIKSPWFLEIGDNVWIGECSWIDNHCIVKIGSNVCISQGVYFCTGNHNWSHSEFSFFCSPIEIGDGAWVTAYQKLAPGTYIPPHHALL